LWQPHDKSNPPTSTAQSLVAPKPWKARQSRLQNTPGLRNTILPNEPDRSTFRNTVLLNEPEPERPPTTILPNEPEMPASDPPARTDSAKRTEYAVSGRCSHRCFSGIQRFFWVRQCTSFSSGQHKLLNPLWRTHSCVLRRHSYRRLSSPRSFGKKCYLKCLALQKLSGTQGCPGSSLLLSVRCRNSGSRPGSCHRHSLLTLSKSLGMIGALDAFSSTGNGGQ
jgi:hypothetical protein